MQYYHRLLKSWKASRLEYFIQRIIGVIQSTASRQVIFVLHFTLVLNKPKTRDGFKLWLPNELLFVLLKFGQFLKVASGDVTRPPYPSTKDDEPGKNKTFDTENTPNSGQSNNASKSSTQDETEFSVQESTTTLPHSPIYNLSTS